eukprot:TRINITY_DN8679_c0_g1_i4.p1 TRINITY_DN8679_c0_g1~~TRINITY_DN8679_c0_g1_i4.p1  ORF type:complete len:506 (-),score=113.82 TRINITY_DN8679_c0_g1_i4:140-1657(-)
MDLFGDDSDDRLDRFVQGYAYTQTRASMQSLRLEGFASLQKFEECVHLLNQSLVASEIPDIGPLPKDERCVPVLNCIHALLQAKMRDARMKEELLERLRKVELEKEASIITQDQLRQKIITLDRTIGDLHIKIKVTEDSKKAELERLILERDNLQRENIALASRDAQYQHELRRKDVEVEKMKDKLSASIRSRDHDSRTAINILHAAEREGKKMPWTKDAKRSDEISMIIRNSYEEKMKESLEENAQLRRLLLDLQGELWRMVSKDDANAEDVARIRMITERHLEMPYSLLRPVFAEETNRILQQLRNQTGRLHGAISDPLTQKLDTETIAELRRELASCHQRIREQQMIIDVAMAAEASQFQQPSRSGLDVSLSEVHAFEKERKALQEERQQLEHLLSLIEAKIHESPAPRRAELRALVDESPVTIKSRQDASHFESPASASRLFSRLPTESPIHNPSRASVMSTPVANDWFRPLPRKLGPDAGPPGMHLKYSPPGTHSPNTFT